MGYYDQNGFYFHEEADIADPGQGFSDLLNLAIRALPAAIRVRVLAELASDPTILEGVDEAITAKVAALEIALRTDPGMPMSYASDGLATITDQRGGKSFMSARLSDGAPDDTSATLISRSLTEGKHMPATAQYETDHLAAVGDVRGGVSFMVARTSDGAPEDFSTELIARTLTEQGYLTPSSTGRLAGPLLAIGDSTTDDDPWPEIAATRLGIGFLDRGVAGQSSTERALDMGVLDATITVTGNTLPASGTVVVTAISPAGTWRTGVSVEWRTPVRVLGERFDLIHPTASAPTWRLERVRPGATIACPPNTPLEIAPGPKTGVGFERLPAVLLVGMNNPADLGNIQRDITAIIGAYDVRVLMTPWPTASEPAGSAGYNRKAAIRDWAQATFPNIFLNGWAYQKNYGLVDLGLTPTAADTLAISQDQIPPQLMNDDTHLTPAASALFGPLIANFILEKGL